MYEYELKEVRIQLREGMSLYSNESIIDDVTAINLIRKEMQDLDRENIWVLNLTTRNKVINYNVVSVGTIDRSTFRISDIFKAAILSNAARIIIFHNHPSGDINPSKEDIDVTKKIIQAGILLGIPLLDHIIVGQNMEDCYSFNKYDHGLFL